MTLLMRSMATGNEESTEFIVAARKKNQSYNFMLERDRDWASLNGAGEAHETARNSHVLNFYFVNIVKNAM